MFVCVDAVETFLTTRRAYVCLRTCVDIHGGFGCFRLSSAHTELNDRHFTSRCILVTLAASARLLPSHSRSSGKKRKKNTCDSFPGRRSVNRAPLILSLNHKERKSLGTAAKAEGPKLEPRRARSRRRQDPSNIPSRSGILCERSSAQIDVSPN